MDGQVAGWVSEWGWVVHGWIDAWRSGWMDRRMEGFFGSQMPSQEVYLGKMPL